MKKTKTDRLFELFAGEYVQILLNKDLESLEQTETHVSSTKMPLAIRGFIVEEDEEYLYLAQNMDVLAGVTITGAVRKSFILHIELGQLEEEVVEMPALDLPKTKEGWN